MSERICSIDGCQKPSRQRGWCTMHYSRWRRTGDPAGARRSIAERIRANSRVNPETGCWEWTGPLWMGYGRTSVKHRTRKAHRVAYEIWKGPIPEGMTIDHLCRVTHCVNPDHLEAVTLAENIHRGNGIATTNAAKTHCLRGHPLSGSNLRITKRGGSLCRVCRTCARDSDTRRRFRDRARKEQLKS